jgi:hypothetical protein
VKSSEYGRGYLAKKARKTLQKKQGKPCKKSRENPAKKAGLWYDIYNQI